MSDQKIVTCERCGFESVVYGEACPNCGWDSAWRVVEVEDNVGEAPEFAPDAAKVVAPEDDVKAAEPQHKKDVKAAAAHDKGEQEIQEVKAERRQPAEERRGPRVTGPSKLTPER